MSIKSRLVYDPIYGFIKLTPVEFEIIHSPFYQRLRWIKQLGFSFYVFPGAEHSRFGHSIGVMNNAHAILKSCDRVVPFSELVSLKSTEAIYHQSIRLGALLHDLGTFCFSHTTEGAYISYGETTRGKNEKGRVDDHENLGSFIIKNTARDGGITRILEKYGLDAQVISDLVKGVHASIMANQILHSEIDCDRMDYLLRDAHYTGLRYGSYDRDYLLHHFQSMRVGNHDILTIKHNALHCVEDFLMSRFSWYSQVIRSARGAKYDAIAEHLCSYMLKKNLIFKYSDLLEMISSDPTLFYQFNDQYFMKLVYQYYQDGTFTKGSAIYHMAHALLFESGASNIRLEEFKQRIISQDDLKFKEKLYKRAEHKIQEMRSLLEEKGSSADWMIEDLPKKEIIFVESPRSIVKKKVEQNILLERDPVKISFETGEIKLLADVENSIMSRLYNCGNFIPNVFCSEGARDLFAQHGLI